MRIKGYLLYSTPPEKLPKIMCSIFIFQAKF
jgi:hypothetical protein